MSFDIEFFRVFVCSSTFYKFQTITISTTRYLLFISFQSWTFQRQTPHFNGLILISAAGTEAEVIGAEHWSEIPLFGNPKEFDFKTIDTFSGTPALSSFFHHCFSFRIFTQFFQKRNSCLAELNLSKDV